MNRETANRHFGLLLSLLALSAWPLAAAAQTNGAEIEEIEEFTVFSSTELEEVIGRIALYPDDLLAIVLPASTYPLQIVEAARFLEALEDDPGLEPDEDWDDSVIALLNYPEVVAMLNEDLDWTWRLGEAVVAQQSDVIAAIELFRDRAYDAGNLESDDYQLVSHEGGSIQITPVEEDVIYVPYYEPEQVVVYQPRPVYFYYPRPYPVYYYPYPSHHVFYHDRFWGVTTAFTIGWSLHHLNVYHHSFYGHPYYGRTYWNDWWYRRPDIHVYNNIYVRNYGPNYNRYRYGDRWYPNVRSTIRSSDQRVTRTRHYPGSNSTHSGNTSFAPARNPDRVASSRESQRRSDRPPISFRDRPDTPAVARSTPNRTSERERAANRPSKVAPTASRPSSSSRSLTTRPSTQPRQTSSRATPKPEPRFTTPARSSNSGSTAKPATRYSTPNRASTSRATPKPETRFAAPSRSSTSRATSPSRPSASSPRQPQVRSAPSKSSSSRAQPSRQSQSKSQPSRSTRSESGSNSRESRRKR